MKIAICGSGSVSDKEVAKKAAIVGEEIAKIGFTLLTGACNGYPNEAAKAAFNKKGDVIGYSPAENKEEHISKYQFPTDNFTTIIYTGLGIPDRNLSLVRNADIIIIINGKVGTLNEFTIAFHYKKKIGILAGSGGITELIPKISELIDKEGESKGVVYSDDPTKLVGFLTK